MRTTRRRFIARGGAAAGAALCLAPLGASGEVAPGSVARLTLPVDSVDASVLALAATCGHSPRLVGGQILGRLAKQPGVGATIVVCVDDPAALSDALHAMPFRPVYAAGDVLELVRGCRYYRIELLPPLAHARRLADLSRADRHDFAHEAVHADPATGLVVDPQHAVSGGQFLLRRTRAPRDLADQVAQMVRGTVDAIRHGLKPDAEFTAFRSGLLSRPALTADETLAVASQLLAAVGPLGGPREAALLAAWMRSPLAAAALPSVTGKPVAESVAAHDAPRAGVAAAGVSNGALWLSALLAPDGVLPPLAATDRRSRLQTLAAFAESRRFSRNLPNAEL